MLGRIKEFFRNLFGLNNNKYIEAPKEIISEQNIEKVYEVNSKKEQLENNFINNLVVNNVENEKALRLQNDFKAGLFEEEDLSEEDFDLLSKLYESQIEQTKQSILTYKNKIMSLKSKLA